MSGSWISRQDRDWIRRHDDHAAARLRLLDEAERALGDGGSPPVATLAHLSDRLERWRCQWLRERRGMTAAGGLSCWQEGDRHLADSLDQMARSLRRQSPRSPRWPRGVVQPGQGGGDEVERARAALDPGLDAQALWQQAREVTARAFASPPEQWPIRLYAPLYLSSHCANRCAYCGFAATLPVERRHLHVDEATMQARTLLSRGFRHLLLVAGDFPRLTTSAYMAEVVDRVAALGAEPSLEIAAQTTQEYVRLRRAGAWGVTLYMETYDEAAYAVVHRRGPKVSYDWRLEAAERAAEAGMQRLGLGILLGLSQPRDDLLALVGHGAYLRQRYPGVQLAFSLPRIHASPDGFTTPHPVDDELFMRLYAALRLAFPAATLVLSTREAATLRQRLAGLCVNQMSAASSTVPGGYEDGSPEQRDGGQFPVADGRCVRETRAWLERAGHPVVWSLAEGLPAHAAVMVSG